MIKINYKPGEDISSRDNKNNFSQLFGNSNDDKLYYKGYYDLRNYINYGEFYLDWPNEGIKFIL